jgi:hypothetical protein
MSMDFEISKRFRGVEIAEGDYSHILNLIGWREQPSFPIPGRVANYTFASKAYLPTQGVYFYSAKLKGIGIWNPEHFKTYSGVHNGKIFNEPHPPTTLEYEYTASIAHFGITNDGEYGLFHSEPAPFGGITHNRALREYDNAVSLLTQKVPVTAPFLVAKYKGLLFKDQELGVVVSLLPFEYPYRLHLILHDRRKLSETEQRFVGEVYQSCGVHAESYDYYDQLKVINTIYQIYGCTVRKFSQAGLYRHSGGLDNLYYNTANARAYLTDLDSSDDLQKLPEDIRSLQILRDFASVLYKFLYRICSSRLIHSHHIEPLREFDPLGKAITGFFPDIDLSMAGDVSSTLWDYFAPIFNAIKEQSVQSYASVNISDYLERDLFFVLAMTKMHPLYLRSSINQLFPCNETFDQMLLKARNYLKGRFSSLYPYI